VAHQANERSVLVALRPATIDAVTMFACGAPHPKLCMKRIIVLYSVAISTDNMRGVRIYDLLPVLWMHELREPLKGGGELRS
jgi:hypothetical protein